MIQTPSSRSARALWRCGWLVGVWGVLCAAAGPPAERALTVAQLSLRSLTILGEARPQDYAEALDLLRREAEAGSPPAQFHLGVAYESGFGVGADLVAAHTWYSLAASGGDEGIRRKAEAALGELLPRMTAEQIREAQGAAKAWREERAVRDR